MVVISDTSPINYLVLIGRIDVLPALYRRVQLPPAVLAELSAASAPSVVSRWVANLPPWVDRVGVVSGTESIPVGLGLGEREALGLAEAV
jgi:predicted nucleic acid-binding protein